MMTEDQVKGLIVYRLCVRNESCNSFHRNHVEGQIRALLGVLTGSKPPEILGAEQIFDLIGCPYKTIKDGFEVDDEWMLAHGYVKEPNGDVRWPGGGW